LLILRKGLDPDSVHNFGRLAFLQGTLTLVFSDQYKKGSPVGVMIFERAGSTRTLKNHYLFITTQKVSYFENLAKQGFQNNIPNRLIRKLE